jgi:hypothetical protein
VPEPSDQLAYALYRRHREIRKIRTDWNDLNSDSKNEWRALAILAIEFCAEMAEAEETQG